MVQFVFSCPWFGSSFYIHICIVSYSMSAAATESFRLLSVVYIYAVLKAWTSYGYYLGLKELSLWYVGLLVKWLFESMV